MYQMFKMMLFRYPAMDFSQRKIGYSVTYLSLFIFNLVSADFFSSAAFRAFRRSYKKHNRKLSLIYFFKVRIKIKLTKDEHKKKS